MKHIFQRRPAPSYQNYTTVHLRAGSGYHQRFTVNRGRAMMWELEKIALQDIVTRLCPRNILDFACGTGRITSFIDANFPTAKVHGIDISETMLDIARNQRIRADYKVMDAEKAISFYGENHFDVILAFRFFANADPALRKSVGTSLCRLLSEDGSLVINNHRNFWWTSYVGRRIAGQDAVGALNSDIEGIFIDEGLRVKHRISLGVWPQGDTRALLLPWRAVKFLERINLASFASYHTLGYNTIWVLSKG